VSPPPPLVRGGGTLAYGRGVGEVPIPTRGYTLWCSIYISMYFVYFVLFSYAHRYVAVGLISATEDLISDFREDVTLNTNSRVRKCCLPFEKEKETEMKLASLPALC
jgi:hypothetical protein